MEKPFSLTLEGRDWSRLYFWYWVPMLLLLILNQVASRQSATDPTSLTPLLIGLAISFLTMLLQTYFAVPIYRTWLPRLTLDGKPFAFGGDTTDYLVLNIKGFLLSVVTLMIYGPWYVRDVLRYLARETSYEGQPARFVGKAGGLLGRLVILVVLMVALVGVVALTIPATTLQAGAHDPAMILWATTVTFVAILILMGPLMTILYTWMVQFTWNGLEVRWKAPFVGTALFVIGQVLLILITLGLWWPAASVHLYRYFVKHLSVAPEGADQRPLAFTGKAGEGYWFLWGQALLTLVTIGFYGAWSGPTVARWFLDRTIRAN